MVVTITKTEYAEEVDELAGRLADWAIEDVERDTAYDDPENAAMELASDVLDGHEWFARSHYGAAAYGCIIQHVSETATDPGTYSDWRSLMEADTPTESLKKLAYCCFEANIIEEAQHRLHDHDGGSE